METTHKCNGCGNYYGATYSRCPYCHKTPQEIKFLEDAKRTIHQEIPKVKSSLLVKTKHKRARISAR